MSQTADRFAPRVLGRLPAMCLAAALCAANGCASLTNPVADGIPVSRLPDEVLGDRRQNYLDLPLQLLRMAPPDPYRVAAGDVLGIYIERVLPETKPGEPAAPIPINIGQDPTLAPSQGVPVTVQENGTLILPQVKPVEVHGKSLEEIKQALTDAYVGGGVIQGGKVPIVVTLLRPRRYRILVVRQDGGGFSYDTPTGALNPARRGTGTPLQLNAYENDVMTALTSTGGLPDPNAANEVVVLRSNKATAAASPETQATSTIRIPLRLRPGQQPPFKPEDIILDNGDIVYIPTRETEIFYTAGLLPGGEYALPRDYDLDVVEALARIRGPLLNGGYNQGNQFINNVVNQGIGSPSPSLLTVLRKTSNGGQIPIRVDLNRAFRDPRERILVKPGDILVLQEKPEEAITRYLNTTFRFNFLGTIIRENDLTGTITYNGP